jgi:diketogulonate reductase-like aldo/keto reductase
MSCPLVTLNDGAKMPIVGLGTFQSPSGVVGEVLSYAIDVGYRHFDCADFYGNEDEIGDALRQAIKSGKVKREELFVTSKVWPTWLGLGRPTLSAKRSLDRLGIGYIDLLLIHWPTPMAQVDDSHFPCDASGEQCLFDDSIELHQVWKEFEEIKKKGNLKCV